MPRVVSSRAKAWRTAATGSAGPGRPPCARWLESPSIATAPVMPDGRKEESHVGATGGP